MLNKIRNREPAVETWEEMNEEGDAEEIFPNLLLPGVVQEVVRPEARQSYYGGVLEEMECHTLTPAWAKRGGVTQDWDSLTCFSDIGGPISYIIS